MLLCPTALYTYGRVARQKVVSRIIVLGQFLSVCEREGKNLLDFVLVIIVSD